VGTGALEVGRLFIAGALPLLWLAVVSPSRYRFDFVLFTVVVAAAAAVARSSSCAILSAASLSLNGTVGFGRRAAAASPTPFRSILLPLSSSSVVEATDGHD